MEISLFNLLLVLLAAWIAGALASRFGYPAILGELAAGILLGPALLGLLHGSEGLKVLAHVGIFLMMLYIGMEVNFRDLISASRPALLAACGGFIIPFFAGYAVMRHLGFDRDAALFLGLAMGVTALAVRSRVLLDLGLLGTRVANVLLAAALITDTVALLAFSAIIGLAQEQTLGVMTLAPVIIKAVLFFGITILIGLRVFPVLGRLLRSFGFTERTANFTLVIMIGLVFAELAELAGLHAILGAFLAGMFIRGEVLQRKLSHEVNSMVRDLSLGFLAPIFFVSVGFEVDIGVFRTDLPFLLLVIALAVVTKVVGTTLFYLFTGYGWREGLTIGTGMNARGAVEIIFAQLALEAGIIDKGVFSVLVFMAFLTTAMDPFLLRWGTNWLRKHGQLVWSYEERKGVLIAGATPLARLLARELAPQEPVVLIDNNLNRCRAAESDGLSVLQGNALSEDLLDTAEAGKARVFIALTSNPEVNRIALQRAREQYGIPERLSISGVSEPAPNAKAQDSHREHRLLYDEAFDMNVWNERIGRKEVEPVTLAVDGERDPREYIKEMLGQDILPMVIRRKNRLLIPATLNRIQPGDELIGLRYRQSEVPLVDPFDRLMRRGLILDLPDAIRAEQLFERAAEMLSVRINIPARKLFKLLMRREQEGSTVLVPGLAVPHIIVDREQVFEMVFVRCRAGVTFLDPETRARIVFILVGSKGDRGSHLRILSAIAQLFQDPSFEDTLLSVESPDKMREVLLSTRRHRF